MAGKGGASHDQSGDCRDRRDAPSHVRGFLEFSDWCEIVALCDIKPDKAKQMARQFSLHVDVYDDHRSMLERDDIDLVSICTPPYTHAELAIDFLDAGKHVFVEKPMASSLEECDAMNEAARRSGKVLSVVAQNRFRKPMMKLKQVLESGLAGRSCMRKSIHTGGEDTAITTCGGGARGKKKAAVAH